jgi:hypothetical protein
MLPEAEMRRAGLLLPAVPLLAAAVEDVEIRVWFGTDANTVGRATLPQ